MDELIRCGGLCFHDVVRMPEAAMAQTGLHPVTRIIALSASHDLEGLIAWSRREEWREPFGTLLDRHAGQTCAAAGVALADIG